jgi:hypothetical protein
LNRKFVQSLADGAKADGTVTPAEADAVYGAARLLNVPDAEVASMLALAKPAAQPDLGGLASGTPVCFLGSFDIGVMAQVFRATTDANLVVRKNVTATVGLVVVESVGANGARVNRAKALGFPVVTSAEFMRLVELSLASA